MKHQSRSKNHHGIQTDVLYIQLSSVYHLNVLIGPMWSGVEVNWFQNNSLYLLSNIQKMNLQSFTYDWGSFINLFFTLHFLTSITLICYYIIIGECCKQVCTIITQSLFYKILSPCIFGQGPNMDAFQAIHNFQSTECIDRTRIFRGAAHSFHHSRQQISKRLHFPLLYFITT